MSTIAIAPEVAAFLDAVRTHLTDLDAEEQREILDGLGADLAELVDEQGPEALGDPAAYAAELRQAAGLEAKPARAGRTRSIRESVIVFLDACHARFDATVEKAPGDARAVLDWARPLWWIARAWLAVQLVQYVFGDSWAVFRVVPDLDGFGWPALLVAVLGSVAVGLGRVWPGGDRGLVARLSLLVLNLVAILSMLAVLGQPGDDTRYGTGYAEGYGDAQQAQIDGGLDSGIDDQAGIYSNGDWVSNIYPYDAAGKPLVGVQLYDQNGEPINVVTQPDCEAGANDPHPAVEDDPDGWTSYCTDQGYDAVQPRVFYPWSNGAAQVFNMFPLPSRFQEDPEPTASAFTDKDKPTIGIFPMESVPKASLPGLATGSRR